MCTCQSFGAGQAMVSSPPPLCRGALHTSPCPGLISSACKKEERTSQEVGEFLREPESTGTLSPFSSCLLGTQSPAQSKGVGEETRTGAGTWVPWLSGVLLL